MKKSKFTHHLFKVVACSLCTLAVASGFFSCDTDKYGNGRPGQLRLTLATDTTSLKKGISSSTRAVSDEFAQFLQTEDYKIRIVGTKDTVQKYDRYDEMPSVIELQEGAYTLIAYKGSNLPAAFDNPYFEGSTEFTVKADMSTPLDVTCTLGNARVTVDYTEDFKKLFTDYTAQLKTSFTGTSNIEIKKDESRPAYLQVAKEGTALSITLRLSKVGESKEISYPVPAAITLERRQNVRLIFKLDGAGNGLGLDVQIDDTLEEHIFPNEDIPDFMLPKQKD